MTSLPGEARAQTYQTWRGENTQGNLLNASAWWNFPNNSTMVFGQQEFDNNVQTTMTNNNGGTVFSTWRWLFKGAASSARTITGNGLRFFDFGGQDGGIYNESSATHVFNVAIEGDDAVDPFQIQLNSTGGLTFGSTVNNQGTGIDILGTAAGAKTVTFSGIVSGSGGMYVNNANATVLFDAANTYTGQLTINAGTVRLNGSGDTFGGSSQDIRIGSGATLDLNGVSTTVGSVAEEGGTDSGSITLGGGTLTVTANSTNIYQSSISGTGGLTKQGSHTLNLFGTQGYTGTTTVSAGLLATGVAMSSTNFTINGGTFATDAANRLADTAAVSVSSGTLTIGGNDTVGSFSMSGGTLGGSSTLTAATYALGGGTITGNLGSGAATNTGTTSLNGILNSTNLVVSGGTITLGSANRMSDTLAATVSGGTLNLGGFTDTVGSFTISGGTFTNGTLTAGSYALQGGAVTGVLGSGGITVTTGTTTLGSANRLNSASALTINSGQLSLGGAETVASVAGSGGTLALGANTISVGGGNASTSFAGAITGSGGALTKTGSGTLTLSGNSSYSGATTLSGGGLVFNGTNTSTATTVGNNSVLGGSGSLGAVTIQSGGRIAPGNSPGTLSVSSLTLEAGSGYNWELDNVAGVAGTNWDLISVGGGAGTVTINSTSGSPHTIYISGAATGFANTNSYSWTIIDAGSLSGFSADKFGVNFTTLNGQTPTGSFSFSNVSGDLILAYTAVASVYDVTVGADTAANQGSAQATNSVAQFTGASALNKSGAGTLIMTNSANDYTGVTTVKEGTIQINVAAPNASAGALGNASSAVIVGDAASAAAAGFNFGVAGITNARGLSVAAGTGAADRIIGTTITSGVAEQAGTVVVNTNTLFQAADGGTLLVSGAISGAGNVTISNSGLNIFSGVNTYTGTTTILTNSTLRIANSSALGTTAGATAVNGGGTLALSNGITSAEGITINGNGVSGGGAIRNISGDNTLSGGIVLGSASRINADTGTTLTLSGGVTGVGQALTLGGAGNITVSTTGINTSTSGSLTIDSTGVVTLGASGNYTGATTLSSGTLRVGNNGALGTGGFAINGGVVASDGGTARTITNAITLGSNVQFGDGTGTGALTLSNINLGASTRTITVSNSTTVAGAITNTGGVTKAGSGTLILSGANTYTGATTVDGGVLSVSGGSAIGDTNVVTITSGTLNLATGETVGSISGGGNIALNGNQLIAGQNNSNTEFSGIMSSSSTNGNFVKKGTGTLTLSGANTMNGPMYMVGGTTLFTVNQGATFTNALFLGEEFADTAAATLAFGGSGLTVANAITVRSGSTGAMVIDALNTSGTTTLNGALTLAKNTTIRANSGGSLLVNGNVSLGTSQLFADSTTGSSLTIAGNISANANRAGELLVNDTGTVVLTGNNSADMKITLTAGTLQVGNISNLGAPTGTFFGDKLNINGGTLSATNNVSAGANFGVTVSANGGSLHASSGSTLTLADFINDSGAGTNAYTLGIGGGGTVALQKATGNNQFNGNMTFSVTNGSTLSTPNLLALGNSSTNIVSLNNGTFAYTGSTGTASQRFTLGASGGTISVTAANLGTTLTLTNIVSGTGNTLTKAGDSILALSGANTYGKTVISGGMLTVGADNNSGATPGSATADSITIGNGRLGLNGNFTLGANRGITLTNANAGIDVYGGNTATVAGVITGAGGLTKFGTGTMILTAANSYEGGTTISVGTLQVGNGGATGQLGAGNITNNTSLIVNRTGTINLNEIISGTGSLTKQAAGTLTLSASNSFSGGSTLSAGVIRAAHNNALGAGALVSSAGTTLELTNGINLANNLSVYNVRFLNGGNTLSGTITNNNTVYDVNAGQTNTLGGFVTGSGSVTLIGGGVLDITGTTNNYTGNTVVSNGTIRISTLANSNNVSSVGVSNNITLAGTTTSTNLNANTTAAIDYTGGNVTTDRAFVVNEGGGTINMATAATEMTLTGSASGSGKLIVGEGTLILSNGSTANSFAPGSIQVDSGATLQLAANNQIGNSTGLILNGGTFRVGTASTGFSDTLGTLTLSDSSTIDLGAWTTGLRQLTFANSSAITWTGTLTITNWQGVALQSSSVAEILFGTGGLTSTQLGQIYFANQNINGGQLIGGELVPVPEPRVYAAAFALLAVVGWRERKRLLGLLSREKRPTA
jgi:fibronectin-binding autotransporter adhesin